MKDLDIVIGAMLTRLAVFTDTDAWLRYCYALMGAGINPIAAMRAYRKLGKRRK